MTSEAAKRPWPPGVRVIGLTGGIASGKSTVAARLRELGASIIDADVVAREVVEPGQPALAEVAERFPGVVDGEGRLDRAALADRVFRSDAERRALNAILHPRIQQAVVEKTGALAARGERLVLYEAPLIVENRIHERLDGLILVVVPRELQLARLMARNALTREEAEARLAAQLPLEEKRKHAQWVIDSSGTVAETRAQVDRLWADLQETSRQRV
jgi:dephospho-CoA kinase